MAAHDLTAWQHTHDFGVSDSMGAERRTRWVVALTFVTMVVELTVGWLTGSMALLADGWHMASHVGAIGLAAFAYRFARTHAQDARFSFGTGKVSALAGYSSALLLGLVALWMAWESLQRLHQPVQIQYGEAMAIAALGLAVNLASAWLLRGEPHAHHHHGHGHAHDGDDDDDHDDDHHDHDHPHQHHHSQHAHAVHAADPHGHDEVHADHNLRAAYMHVIADAFTSVLAIAALAGGMLWGLAFLDPLMGIVGAIVIGRWAWGLLRDSSSVLLDAQPSPRVTADVRRAIGTLPDHDVADLHLWRVGPDSLACIVSLVSHSPRPVQEYRALLARVPGLDHVTVEVHRCSDPRCRREGS